MTASHDEAGLPTEAAPVRQTGTKPAGCGIDLFCRVVDNFGDIGVCWRLARQLATLAGPGRVRLWVDDLATFRRIQPDVGTQTGRQMLAGVEIIHWTNPAPDLAPRDIVIEAFACDPPDAFIDRMKQGRHVWINLEYLSAEPWIETCHARPSIQPSGMTKTFFFPGFTPGSGGLPREDGLLDRRDRWLADPAQRWRLLRDVGVPAARVRDLETGGFQALLFCYPHAPTHALVEALRQQGRPSVVLVPEGVAPGLTGPGDGPVHIIRIPFVDQEGFDRLLWSSDLNLVRGEDSLVRAIWAGKPLIWHIYPQDENTHMDKLDAWLRLASYPAEADAALRAWNAGDTPAFRDNLEQTLQPATWARWQAACGRRAGSLAQSPGLAQALLAFCAKYRQTR